MVMDAMEAESAAGRTTPSGGGQPLEAIQLFEQADSKDVRVGQSLRWCRQVSECPRKVMLSCGKMISCHDAASAGTAA